MASTTTHVAFLDSRVGWTLRDRWAAFQFPPAALRFMAVGALVLFGAIWGMLAAVAGVPAVLICASLIACVFCLRDFRAGVGLLVLMMPIANSQVFPRSMFGITGLNPLNLLLATTLLAFLMNRAGEKQAPRVFPWQLLWLYLVPFTIAACLGISHISQIPPSFYDLDLIQFTGAVGYLRDLWAKPVILVIYALLVGAAAARSERPERFLTPMMLSVWVMAGMAVVFVAMSGVSLSQLAGTYARSFLSALGMHANDLGRLYATAYAILLFTWDRTENWSLKTFCLLAMGAVVVALLLTFSRGAFFGFILVNLIYLFARRRLKTLLMAGLAVPVALVLMPGAVWYRMTMGFGSGMNTITAGRTGDIWEPLWPELADYALTGNGIGSVMWSRAMRDGRLWEISHPHNAYLEAYMNMGVLGLVLFVVFWIWIWRSFRREAKNAAHPQELRGVFEGGAAGLLAYLVAGMAGGSLQPDATQAFLWFAIGMLFGVKAKAAKRAAQEKAQAAALAKSQAQLKVQGR